MPKRTFTFREKVQAVMREIGYRKRVYERRVLEEKMTRQKADYEIEIMESIADDLAKLAQRERLI